jgi:hypothetical protein
MAACHDTAACWTHQQQQAFEIKPASGPLMHVLLLLLLLLLL